MYRYVVTEYWNNPHASYLYLKEAKASQSILGNNFRKPIVEVESNKISTLRRCASSIHGDIERAMNREFEKVLLNTLERRRYWKIAFSHLAGNRYKGVHPDDYHALCPSVVNF